MKVPYDDSAERTLNMLFELMVAPHTLDDIMELAGTRDRGTTRRALDRLKRLGIPVQSKPLRYGRSECRCGHPLRRHSYPPEWFRGPCKDCQGCLKFAKRDPRRHPRKVYWVPARWWREMGAHFNLGG